MGDFFNIKLKINNREETIQVEKGVTFENNGAKYVVDSNGTLKKCDKSNNNNIWTNADEITLTEYQYSVFRAISDNNKDEGLSQKDIQTAFDQYGNGKFKNDIKKELSNGYNIESTELKKSEKQVSLVVKNGNSGAKLTFGITNTTPKVQKKSDTEQSQKYTVQAGDSLGKIAESFGISIKELMEINGIKNPDEIKAGQVLKLNGYSEVTENKRTGKSIYDVIPKSYDSYIKDVAKKAGVSEDTVKLIMITESSNGQPHTTPYKCSSGVLTIGFGHTNLIGTRPFNKNTEISVEEAFEILAEDIIKTISNVKNAVGENNFNNLPSYAKDSLVDWGFNAGTKRLKKSDNVKANIASKSCMGLITTSVWNNDDPRRSAYRLMNVCKNLNSEQKKYVKNFLDRKVRNSNSKESYYNSVCKTLTGAERKLFIEFYKNLG